MEIRFRPIPKDADIEAFALASLTIIIILGSILLATLGAHGAGLHIGAHRLQPRNCQAKGSNMLTVILGGLLQSGDHLRETGESCCVRNKGFKGLHKLLDGRDRRGESTDRCVEVIDDLLHDGRSFSVAP